METRGRRPIGSAKMSGTERNRRSKEKKFGKKAKRIPMTAVERSDKRKIKGLMARIIRAAIKLTALPKASLPMRLILEHDLTDFSKYNYDFNPHNINRTPHHAIN